MIKHDSLRQAIAATVPEFGRDPERLAMWIDKGRMRAHRTENLSFEYRYTLNILAFEYAGSPSAVMIAIIAWLAIHQPDLLTANQDAFDFDVDVLDNDSVDMAIRLELTESVSVTAREDGGYDLQHLAEPDPLFADDFAPEPLLPIPPLSEIWLHTGEKLMPDQPPLGADVQP